MSRYVLALHAGHNASAVIGDEEGLRFAIQEERLTGEKNYWGFPARSVQACLDAVGGTAKDVAIVSYGGKQVLSRRHSRDDVLKAYSRQDTVLGKLRQRVAMPLMLAAKPDYGQDQLAELLEEVGLGKVVRRHHDHHTAHAASAYYGLRRSADEPYLVVTADGSGDGLSATVRLFEHGEPREVATTHWDSSLGALYSWVTYLMGFVPLEHEYKLMGMAPYASPDAAKKAMEVFRKYLWLDDGGLRFQKQTFLRTNDLNESLRADLSGMRFDYICAGIQLFTEELLSTWVANAVHHTGVKNVLAAGGVFMNVKASKRIAELPEVESFEVFPSCGDETLPFGAYWLEAARLWGNEAVRPLPHLYWGDAPSDEDIEAALRDRRLKVERPDDVARAVADLLIAGHPVARCSGTMEFGARALCNRSILADPSNQDVVRVINQMVKKRDFWMPFAPVVMEERQDEYIVNPKKLRSPYMMMTFDTMPDTFREFIAAVHNADLTCRPQILNREQNPEVYAIMKAFEAKTGRAVLLNTSFNLHGFPIVRTADEALDVLEKSGLEYLQLGSLIVSKA